MTLTVVVGIACAVVGTIASLPQAIRLLRAHTSAGVSLVAWQIWFGVGMAWTAHGILMRSPILIVPNVFAALIAMAIIIMIRRDRGLGLPRVLWTAFAIFAVALAVRLGAGPVPFGLFMVLPQSVGVLGQFVDLVRCPDIRGVSSSYLWVILAIQSLWSWYGVLAGDHAILVTAAVMTVLCLLNVVWFLLRRAGVVAAHPGFAVRGGESA